jgi:hypothetical protein
MVLFVGRRRLDLDERGQEKVGKQLGELVQMLRPGYDIGACPSSLLWCNKPLTQHPSKANWHKRHKDFSDPSVVLEATKVKRDTVTWIVPACTNMFLQVGIGTIYMYSATKRGMQTPIRKQFAL